jgi:hypothetical protein
MSRYAQAERTKPSPKILQYALTKCRQDSDATKNAKAELARAKRVAEDFVRDFWNIEGA